MKKSLFKVLGLCFLAFIMVFGIIGIASNVKDTNTYYAPISCEYETSAETTQTYKVAYKYALMDSKVNNYQKLATPGFVGDLWDALKDTITDVVDVMVSVFQGVVPVFYDSSANSGAGGLTIVGWMSIISLGFGFFYLGLNFIRSLIGKMRGR